MKRFLLNEQVFFPNLAVKMSGARETRGPDVTIPETMCAYPYREASESVGVGQIGCGNQGYPAMQWGWASIGKNAILRRLLKKVWTFPILLEQIRGLVN